MKSNIGVEANPPKEKCEDARCPWHGKLPVRGRVFEGTVKSTKPNKTAIVSWDYNLYLQKYERFERRKSRLSAYNPSCLRVKEGDKVKIAECRPVSKTKSFVVVSKI